MKRGTRILLILLVLIVILSVVAFFLLRSGGGQFSFGAPAAQTDMVDILVLAAPVAMDDQIVEASLTTMPFSKDHLNPSMIVDKNNAIGKYARFDLGAGTPLTLDMLQERPGMSQTGSQAAKTIPPGMVAVSIPVNQLNSVAYGLKDGDKVNIIITTKFYDADTDFQSKLPNETTIVFAGGGLSGSLTAVTKSEGWVARQGHSELDNTLGQALYVVPGEAQRPRIVTQTLLQDIQILHVGDFTTTGTAKVPEGQPTPTPAPVYLPNVVTLMVTPQDAVVITYLMSVEATFNMVLRAPDDTSKIDTEAATLQYLLSQYEIPVPSKLPYIMDNSQYSPVPPLP